jgi:hypothetical protein
LTTPDREQCIDDENPGVHGLGDEIALDNAGSGPLDRKVRFGGDRPFAIERTAEGIDDASQQTRPDRHPHDLAGPSDPRAGFDGIAFVGVPRTMNDGEGSGVAPTDALSIYDQLVPNRGAILIPTREGEHGRFNFKCDQGATYGLTQLLYSDAVVGFLSEFAKTTDHRPEILLSFGFVPKVETRVGLINWLIQDPGNAAVADEQAFVSQLAETDPAQKRKLMIDLYKRVVDGVADLGFPLSIHLEAAYGTSAPAFETFAEMLDYWSPDKG